MSSKRKLRYVATKVLAVASLWSVAAYAGSDDGTAVIQRESENAKALKLDEPSYQTREERLKAKPLDWRATSGKPKRRTLTNAEKESLRKAKPESTEGGAPDPQADAEARKLHPDDWKPKSPANR